MGIQELLPGFEAENDVERRLVEDSALLEGLAWGRPRKGHPEGSIANHVNDLLQRLDSSGVQGEERAKLRFLVLVHDSFKNRVQEWRPRAGENHHAMRARRFAERYTDDETLLTTLELHDRPYGIWRRRRRTGLQDRRRLESLLERINASDPELFMRFVELDGSTEGKRSDPIEWFREQLRENRQAA